MSERKTAKVLLFSIWAAGFKTFNVLIGRTKKISPSCGDIKQAEQARGTVIKHRLLPEPKFLHK